ncbi:MAG: sugar ABC transporter permease [Provencibacterium sp.]|jgi:putative aldouronate transport system permease protein|nr:sugar ABC transporter permease [Provencibacterium sp.]
MLYASKGQTAAAKQKEPFGVRWAKNWQRYKFIYIMLLPVVAYYIIFHYIPMGGAVIAFQDYTPAKGILGSDWVGMRNFVDFLTGPYAWRLIRNTLLLNVYQIIFGFPAPILLALLINEVRCKPYKKFVQTISYMPHFISLVVICGLLMTFCRTDGLFNDFLALFGAERSSLLARPELFRTIFTASGIWQSVGWGSIIYLATLSNVDPNLHEAAAIDGASRVQRMLHVSFPCLVPVIIVQLIMRLGNILTQGFEKIILLYSPLTYETADVISSYVYRRGLEQMDYSFGSAVGIFNSAVNLTMLVLANYVSRRTTEESLW